MTDADDTQALLNLIPHDYLRKGGQQLAEICSLDDLKTLWGRPFDVKEFREFMREKRGCNSLTKISCENLAAALILKYGSDLFADKSRRDVIAKRCKCKVKNPLRWDPGKKMASDFVQAAGFDAVFAGISSKSPSGDPVGDPGKGVESPEPRPGNENEPDDTLDLSVSLEESLLSGALRLSDIFTHEDLTGKQEKAGLLERPLLNGFRSLAKTVLGKTPNLSKQSLSAALILQHGADLFAKKSIRDAVAQKLSKDAQKIQSPGKWRSGKAAAIEFVQKTGFDEAFAGTPVEQSPDDVEWFKGRAELKPLADFQEEVLSKCQQNLDAEHKRAIVTLPTGGGKTRVASEYVTWFLTERERSPAVTLWVAHTEELLEQAVEGLRQVWSDKSNAPDCRLDRRFGQHGKEEKAGEELLGAHECPQILVATPQRLLNDFTHWQENHSQIFNSWCNRVRLLVIDEAHRAAAPQYRKLIDFFERRSKPASETQKPASETQAPTEPIILGLTATPFRKEYANNPELGTQELLDIFKQPIEPSLTLGDHPREALQKPHEQRGQVLARPKESRIETFHKLTISDIKGVSDEQPLSVESMDRIDREMKKLADEATRRALVFQHLSKICQAPQNRVLYFGPSVEDAGIMTLMLRALRVPAALVSGNTRRPERRRIIQAFREGKVRVLCNCEVLTTGFDAPKVTHVVIARPTVSHVLFEQMVGRGLRGPAFGGTEVCHVTYFVDKLDVPGVQMGYDGWRKIWGLDGSDAAGSATD